MNWKFGPVHDTILKEGNFVPVRVLARGNRGGGGNYGLEGKMLWRLVKYRILIAVFEVWPHVVPS